MPRGGSGPRRSHRGTSRTARGRPGADQTEAFSFLTYPGLPGGTFVASGDVNGDGRDDALTAPFDGAAHVKAFSGVDLSPLAGFIARPGAVGVYVG